MTRLFRPEELEAMQEAERRAEASRAASLEQLEAVDMEDEEELLALSGDAQDEAESQ